MRHTFAFLSLAIFILSAYAPVTASASMPAIADLRARLTPEARQCILKKLGRQKARQVAAEIRTMGRMDPATWAQIAPCFETPASLTKVPPTIAPSITARPPVEATPLEGTLPYPPSSGNPNPFGVMLPSQLVRAPGGIEVAKTLGAVYFRPSSVFLDRWNGTCEECDIALNAGLQLVLTVRNSGPLPTAPPKDLSAYQRTLGQVLNKYRPVVLAVENEENSALFYTGTPQDYAAELKAACQVAHQKGIPCTNGGLVSTLVALLVYAHYLETGQTALAQDFAMRAFSPEERQLLDSPKAQEQLRKGKALLSAYRAAGVDYVNFHWYIADTQALAEAVAYLRAQTGLPVITNEVGQTTDDPNQTTAVMGQIVELGIPIAVWFGLDGPKARGLVNSDGTLRPTGEAFQRFIDEHFRPIFMPTPTGQNPFGVIMTRLVRESPEQGIQVVKELGAVYFRPEAVHLEQWNGQCPTCDAALNAGLKLVLTVRNSGPLPSYPPSDLSAYKRKLGEVLDKYRPVILVVENEENSDLSYTGTPEEYGTELATACQAAHQKGIPCTNGGLGGIAVALLVYDHYLETGQEAKAQDFAMRAFRPEERQLLNSPKAQEQLRRGKALLQVYRRAGIDYMNFHWYIADTQALEEAVSFLKAQTGLPLLTNEVGQRTDDPNQTTAVMGQIVELGLPIAIWWAMDGPLARGLVNPDGTLRPTGEAFQRFIDEHFRPIFGVHVVLAQNTPDAAVIHALGARVTTLWLYPAPGGRFNVHQASQLVNLIKEQTGGLDVYVHLMPNARSEAMGAGVGDPELPESGAGFALPADMATYLASLRELAAALKGSVTYYSIGNEVSGFSWKGTVQDYGALLAQSASAIKSVDPDAKILDSGMAGLTYALTIPYSLYQAGKTAEALDFTRRYTQNHAGAFSQFLPIDDEAQLQALLADPRVQKTIQLSNARFKEYCPYYDLFQLHDYQGWETMEEVYDWIHEQMRANHCVKPIQAWEIGYGLDRNLPYDLNEHARSVTKVLTISAAEGAKTIIYFPLTDRGNYARGLLGPNNEMQPPAIAYRVTAAKLSDATSAEKLNLGEGVWGYKFGRSGGDVYVLWSTAPTTVHLPLSAPQVTVTDQTGATRTASPDALQIDVDPVFVEAR